MIEIETFQGVITLDNTENNNTTFSFSSSVSVHKEYYSIDLPKIHIAKAIKEAIEEQGLSLRKLANNIENMSYPQISRVTTQENYNINTLLKILDALDLELVIKHKPINCDS
jgi:ribosome-binding protein aMBF1 (putative translation factor)